MNYAAGAQDYDVISEIWFDDEAQCARAMRCSSNPMSRRTSSRMKSISSRGLFFVDERVTDLVHDASNNCYWSVPLLLLEASAAASDTRFNGIN